MRSGKIGFMQDFDFDYWKNLASASPLEFEAQRRKALQQVVDGAPSAHQPALAALLETLCARQQGTPLERAIHAQTLMMESVGYLSTAWVTLVEATRPLTHPWAYHLRPGPNTNRS